MKRSPQRAIRLGIFIAAGILLFVIAIYLIGNKQNMFGINVKVTTVFADVKGLRQGAVVRFTGIDVGAVSKLEILTDSSVLVEMAIERKVTHFIKKNSTATIASRFASEAGSLASGETTSCFHNLSEYSRANSRDRESRSPMRFTATRKASSSARPASPRALT